MCSRLKTPCLPTEPHASDKSYEIVRATETDAEHFMKFLYKSYLPDEPLHKALNVIETPDSRNAEVDAFYRNLFSYGVSLKAVAPTGDIIGVCLNKVISKGEDEKLKSPNGKMQKIASLLNEVNGKADVFGKNPDADKVLRVKILSVDASWRKKGIAGEFFARIKDVAMESGCKVVTVDCTNEFAALAARKRGFECLYSLAYADYKENDEVVFRPEKPHETAAVYALKL